MTDEGKASDVGPWLGGHLPSSISKPKKYTHRLMNLFEDETMAGCVDCLSMKGGEPCEMHFSMFSDMAANPEKYLKDYL
jgi:hypothetical protein